MEDKKVGEGTKVMKRKMMVRNVPRAKLMTKPMVLFPGRSLMNMLVLVVMSEEGGE